MQSTSTNKPVETSKSAVAYADYQKHHCHHQQNTHCYSHQRWLHHNCQQTELPNQCSESTLPEREESKSCTSKDSTPCPSKSAPEVPCVRNTSGLRLVEIPTTKPKRSKVDEGKAPAKARSFRIDLGSKSREFVAMVKDFWQRSAFKRPAQLQRCKEQRLELNDGHHKQHPPLHTTDVKPDKGSSSDNVRLVQHVLAAVGGTFLLSTAAFLAYCCLEEHLDSREDYSFFR
jgi:hypothetical protein